GLFTGRVQSQISRMAFLSFTPNLALEEGEIVLRSEQPSPFLKELSRLSRTLRDASDDLVWTLCEVRDEFVDERAIAAFVGRARHDDESRTSACATLCGFIEPFGRGGLARQERDEATSDAHLARATPP